MTEFAIVRWDTYLSKDKSTIYPVVYIKRDKDFIDHFERNKFRMQCKVSDTKTDYDGEQLYQGIILNEAKEVFSGDDKYLKDASYILIILKTRFIEHVPFHLGKITVVDFDLDEEKKQQEQLDEIIKTSTENLNNVVEVQKKIKSDFDIIAAEYSRLKSISDNDSVLINSTQETLAKATKDANDAAINLEISKNNFKKIQEEILTLTSKYDQISAESANYEISVEKAKKIYDSASLEVENSKVLLVSASDAYKSAQQDADIAINTANKTKADILNSNQNNQDLTTNTTPDTVKISNANQLVDDANLKISILEKRKKELSDAQLIVNNASDKATLSLDDLNKVGSVASQIAKNKQVILTNISDVKIKLNNYSDEVKNATSLVENTSNTLTSAVENSKTVNKNSFKNSYDTKIFLEIFNKNQDILNKANEDLQIARNKLDIAVKNKQNYINSLKPLVSTVKNANLKALKQEDSAVKSEGNNKTLKYILIIIAAIVLLFLLIYMFPLFAIIFMQ